MCPEHGWRKPPPDLHGGHIVAVATESSGSDQGGGGKGEKGPRVSMGSGVRMMSRKSSCPGDVHRPGVPPGEQCLLASVSLLLSRALHALHPFMQWSCPASMPHPKLRVLQFVQGPSSLLCIVSSVHQATADKNKTQIVTFPWWMPEKAMAPHYSTLAWKIPWMEEPGRLRSMGLRRVRHD